MRANGVEGHHNERLSYGNARLFVCVCFNEKVATFSFLVKVNSFRLTFEAFLLKIVTLERQVNEMTEEKTRLHKEMDLKNYQVCVYTVLT